MGFDAKYYLSAGLRRLPVFLTILFAVTALFAWISIKTPSTFEASARLLVADAVIDIDDTGRLNGAGGGEQLEVMEQQLMTRPNLLEIANTHGVFPDIQEMSPDDVVEIMRELTTIERITGRDRATLMRVSFFADRPQVVARVVNDYITRIQEQAKGTTVREAEANRDFFFKQREKLSAALDRSSERIAEFKTLKTGELPESLEFRMNRQAALQERISQWRREKSALEEQRRRLVEIYQATGDVDQTTGPAQTPDQARLERLRNQLEEMLSVLSPNHPRVRPLEVQISQLEQKISRTPTATQTTTTPVNPTDALFDAQLAERDSQIMFLEDQISSTEEELVSLSESIERTPSNAITLEAMEREFSNTQDQYNTAVASLAKAETDVLVVSTASGRRLEVIEQPVVPTEPVSPNRPLIAGAGAFIGFIIGTGVVVALEMLNRAIRRPLDLTRGLGISPLVTIPYIRTRREIFMTRLKAVAIPVVVTGIAAASLFAVDQFVMPLDLVLDRITDRLAL